TGTTRRGDYTDAPGACCSSSNGHGISSSALFGSASRGVWKGRAARGGTPRIGGGLGEGQSHRRAILRGRAISAQRRTVTYATCKPERFARRHGRGSSG